MNLNILDGWNIREIKNLSSCRHLRLRRAEKSRTQCSTMVYSALLLDVHFGSNRVGSQVF